MNSKNDENNGIRQSDAEGEMAAMAEASHEVEGSLAQKYLNQEVRVYLTNGSILSGHVESVKGYEVLLHDRKKHRESVVNLNQAISISKL